MSIFIFFNQGFNFALVVSIFEDGSVTREWEKTYDSYTEDLADAELVVIPADILEAIYIEWFGEEEEYEPFEFWCPGMDELTDEVEEEEEAEEASYFDSIKSVDDSFADRYQDLEESYM